VSLFSSELGKWAEAMGKGDEFLRRAFHAYFAEGRNIALLPELEAIAEGVGLPKDEVYDVLCQGLFADAVNGDWAKAVGEGITAVPFHILEGRALVGFHPYEEYVKLLAGE
jgi:predicted DsbA family dithiol-disulfide isomerase